MGGTWNTWLINTVAIVALKGGVDKGSVVAGLGLSLVSSGYKVGAEPPIPL